LFGTAAATGPCWTAGGEFLPFGSTEGPGQESEPVGAVTSEVLGELAGDLAGVAHGAHEDHDGTGFERRSTSAAGGRARRRSDNVHNITLVAKSTGQNAQGSAVSVERLSRVSGQLRDVVQRRRNRTRKR
jgi:hypothetical protein